jgi:hypothetical protein
MMETQHFMQAIMLAGNPGLVVLGVIITAIGIILNHFFPSKYWIAVIAAGIIVLVVGLILLLFGVVCL